MASGKTLTIGVKVEGARETLAAFRRLPKEASDALRTRSLELSQRLVELIASAARSDSPQSALMAPTVRARRDRIPAIEAGGSKRVGRHSKPAWAVLFGSEFGSNHRSGWYGAPRYAGSSGRQYRPHVGAGSYWLFKTVGAHESQVAATWRRVAEDVERAFARGGSV